MTPRMSDLHPFPAPGLVFGDYPERREKPPAHDAATRLVDSASDVFARLLGKQLARHRRFAQQVTARTRQWSGGAAFPVEQLLATQAALARGRASQSDYVDAFALACVASVRHLGLQPRDTQVMAARCLLDRQLAEVATGEGKTIAIALAASVAALSGAPIHVVTANDYLAARDAAGLNSFYAALGLTVSAVAQNMRSDARRTAYRADVTYCTAKELAFDYLRDGLARPRDGGGLMQRARRLAGERPEDTGPVMRGLCVAIIDEADTVLIDEARVPLVIACNRDIADDAQFFVDALEIARACIPGVDYVLAPERNAAELTDHGRERVLRWPAQGGTLAGNQRHREQGACLALAALHLYQRDRDYVVKGGLVTIVDETTGRGSPGRAWSRGLHQLMELKEGCKLTERSETSAQITYQRFFNRYLHLCGMSATLRECRAELRLTYGLGVVPIPRHLPSRQVRFPSRLFATNAALFSAVTERAATLSRAGRPVLIGTSSVAESTHLSDWLTRKGLAHALLNARQDSEEAAVVVRAGESGCITVATSMAGRGTDIALAPEAMQAGGLHVILCQHNPSRRIDRQFIGRAGRRGEPGSYEVWLSMQSRLFAFWVPTAWQPALAGWISCLSPVSRFTAAVPQWIEERAHARQRLALARADQSAERAFAFSGKTAT